MRRSGICAVVAALIVLGGCGGSDQSEKPATWASSPAALDADGYIVIPRTNVALRPPDGFQGISSLPGMGRVGTRSTFLVTQSRSAGDPGDVIDGVAAKFSDAVGTRRDGLEFESVQRFSVDGRPALGAMGTQTVGDMTVNKAVMVFVSGRFAVTLTATLDPRDPVTAAEAMLVLRSARWVAGAALDRLGVAITPARRYHEQAWSDGLCYVLRALPGRARRCSSSPRRWASPDRSGRTARRRPRALPRVARQTCGRVRAPREDRRAPGLGDHGNRQGGRARSEGLRGHGVHRRGRCDRRRHLRRGPIRRPMPAIRSMARSLVFP